VQGDNVDTGKAASKTVGRTGDDEVFLSIIIPAYNEQRRLGASLKEVLGFLSGQQYIGEVLIVENGSSDNTFEIAQSAARENPSVRAVREQRRGKGRAVRRGMLEARGKYRFLCDADLSMPIDQVNRFLPPELPDPEVAIASRGVPGAIVYNRPAIRALTAKWFNRLTRTILLPGLKDTQCGFKCFRADVAEFVFGRQVVDGMAFDAEVLCIARRQGYRIVEVPIPWYFDADSRVRLITDSARMALDLLNVRRNCRRGIYD